MTRPLRLLLIDDSIMDRHLAEEVFAEYGHLCTVTTVGSGQAALNAMLAPKAPLPDVVLLDINMPGMSGFEVLTAMKSHAQLSRIPVVMLTTSSHDQDITQAYTLHASSYLIKSVNFQDFVAQVEGFLDFWTKARLTTWPEALSP
ncbi:response regulator receiver protein [Deinococcus phoenicis]|uniref:Response regulator receiver protein n=1 Tax=Deinococcus phoenicis TaxID=1476583 RepID=A0A016QLS6_9DEIO|nr:response regulator [Deinococcus phoenicis]EYB67060.1 response regulator receiver protein [Deinococcus phoenicis]